MCKTNITKACVCIGTPVFAGEKNKYVRRAGSESRLSEAAVQSRGTGAKNESIYIII